MQLNITDKQYTAKMKEFATAARATGHFNYFSFDEILQKVIYEIKDDHPKEDVRKALKKLEEEIFDEEQIHHGDKIIDFRRADERHKMQKLIKLAKETGLFQEISLPKGSCDMVICKFDDESSQSRIAKALSEIEKKVFGHKLFHEYHPTPLPPLV